MTIHSDSKGIKIENVGLRFGETEVLKGVNLNIEPGEFFAFLGPSGSGKSTLLRAIAGFGPNPSGRILIGDRDVTGLPPWQRNVGMVFQSYALWPHMTVRKNVAFGLEERKVPKKEVERRVEEALDLVGLSHLAERRPSELSGGQQQRIALARTVVVEPQVLLLDEPLSNLDANLRVQMRRDILQLQRKLGLTTIFVTHDQEEANTTSDRMAVLSDGVIQQIGRPMELYDNPKNRFVAGFLGSANIIDGEVRVDAKGPAFVSDKGLVLDFRPHAEGPGSLVFRPQNTFIRRSDSSTDNCLEFAGKVVYREFLGSLIRYGVEVAGHLLAVDEMHRIGLEHVGEGADVSLCVDLNQTVLVNA
ncbi:ABC transporter ATP-binding protein [Motiliproteus sp. SC1-56]|uniref:ABC transporter ATP-binding protein n=1 Tax=Motiliproteus sp. SC1-56 TaxID=2799565 RepID=UPI001A8EA404|nr:ABC transporter ATP-binding protein [Motiliproteus sp. SC1-56]